jgi:hypothetical protein
MTKDEHLAKINDSVLLVRSDMLNTDFLRRMRDVLRATEYEFNDPHLSYYTKLIVRHLDKAMKHADLQRRVKEVENALDQVSRLDSALEVAEKRRAEK